MSVKFADDPGPSCVDTTGIDTQAGNTLQAGGTAVSLTDSGGGRPTSWVQRETLLWLISRPR